MQGKRKPYVVDVERSKPFSERSAQQLPELPESKILLPAIEMFLSDTSKPKATSSESVSEKIR